MAYSNANNNADPRLQLLRTWLQSTLGRSDYTIAPASADASFRRYFRIGVDGATHIVMDAPPDKEPVGPYIAVATRLERLGLNVPHIGAQDPAQGFLLLSDLGNRTYLQALNADTVARLYDDALGALVTLQTGIFEDSDFLPPYDHALLMREMELFRTWYLGRHLGATLTPAQDAALTAAFTALVQAALAQTQVWVHRDYHSRNLMVTAERNPGILDFQDAVRGPITYDLVSLLRDCYIAWPRAQVEEWVRDYHRRVRKAGLPTCADADEFLRWFDLMGVQRHLKATGIFARLFHRDGKPGYLPDIPRTLGYVREVSARYDELSGLATLLADVAPA